MNVLKRTRVRWLSTSPVLSDQKRLANCAFGRTNIGTPRALGRAAAGLTKARSGSRLFADDLNSRNVLAFKSTSTWAHGIAKILISFAMPLSETLCGNGFKPRSARRTDARELPSTALVAKISLAVARCCTRDAIFTVCPK